MKLATLVSIIALSALMSACAHHHKVHNKKGIVKLTPTKGKKVKGTVFFAKQDKHKMEVSGTVTGLTPNKRFGFHIHEYGDCSSDDGKSAGGHFNPMGKDHGGVDGHERHMGDLGNIESNGSGVASFTKVFDHMSLSHPGYGVAGRAVIVHGAEDDLASQPTGNAGPRWACGVIGIAQE